MIQRMPQNEPARLAESVPQSGLVTQFGPSWRGVIRSAQTGIAAVQTALAASRRQLIGLRIEPAYAGLQQPVEGCRSRCFADERLGSECRLVPGRVLPVRRLVRIGLEFTSLDFEFLSRKLKLLESGVRASGLLAGSCTISLQFVTDSRRDGMRQLGFKLIELCPDARRKRWGSG